LNLELSVAITHNFATEYPSLFLLNKAIAQAEPELAGRFEIALKSSRPDLFSIVGFPQVNHELSFETIDHACTVQH
jgi:N-acetylglutamate synthase-like GNAT family acetyltransferase